jgi:hypothetical protein
MPEADMHEKRIMLPDTEASYDGLKRVLAMQGYELNKKDMIGKLAKGMTISDIAKHHDVDVEILKYELDNGIQTEMEHTDDPKIAEAIAMDHLYEDPHYYAKLKRMEQSYSSGGPVRIPSTDPSTWNAEYKIGDKVFIRIDFARSTDVNEVRTIVNVRTFLGQYTNPTSTGIQRPENPSGRLYTLDNGQDWEGKDLEYANVQNTPTQPANTSFPVPSTPIPTPAPISLPGLQTPTGAPSKLDFKMQALVRTDVFKRFFGDWEAAATNWLANNKANMAKYYAGCSLVIDIDTLEPRVMYHGTNTAQEFFEFDILERNPSGDITRKRPYGYFAYNEEYARNFTLAPQRPGGGGVQIIYDAFLAVKKPFMAIDTAFMSMSEDEDVWMEEISKRIAEDQHGHKNLPQQEYERRLDVQRNITRQRLQGKQQGNKWPFWRYMATDIDNIFKYFLISYGYDGVFYYENFNIQYDMDDPAQFTKAITVFEPRQIKLADGRNIDFNPMTNDIRYQEGGKTDQPTIPGPKTHLESVERVIFPWKYAQGGEVKGKGLKDGDDGKKGGYLVGRSHADGGIKAFNVDTGKPLEVEGNEVIITKKAVLDDTKRLFEGEMLTNREILSRINQSGGGVSFEKGGEMESCGCMGRKYMYGGIMMQDYDIVNLMSYPGQVVDTVQEQATRFANYLVRALQPEKP